MQKRKIDRAARYRPDQPLSCSIERGAPQRQYWHLTPPLTRVGRRRHEGAARSPESVFVAETGTHATITVFRVRFSLLSPLSFLLPFSLASLFVSFPSPPSPPPSSQPPSCRRLPLRRVASCVQQTSSVSLEHVKHDFFFKPQPRFEDKTSRIPSTAVAFSPGQSGTAVRPYQ